MPKNIVLLSDGTANSDKGVVFTNIAKLYLTLKDLKNPNQEVFYDSGIGTEGNFITCGFAQLTGSGIKQNIIDLYTMLISKYELGDRIFLFGFSRGATTVRSLAGMIRKVGILNAEHKDLIEEAYRLYNSQTIDVDGKQVIEFRQRYSYFDKVGDNDPHGHATQDVGVQFLGVYDTVEALGLPGLSKMRDSWFGFHDLRLSRMIKVARHALALDERREDFKPTLWIPHRNRDTGEITDSEQRWFPGVHSDIGGGYEHHGLADSAYIWMMSAAQRNGLILPKSFLTVDSTPYYVSDHEASDASDDERTDDEKRKAQTEIHPNFLGKLHDSSFFMRIRSHDIRVPGMTSRHNPPQLKLDECVDEKVRQRIEDGRKDYHPVYSALSDARRSLRRVRPPIAPDDSQPPSRKIPKLTSSNP